MTTPNIPGWARLEQCPKTSGCAARVVWKDADGNLFRLDGRSGDFVEHHCQVRGSEKPTVAYLGEWYNPKTNRTRWVGPKRLRESAQRPPMDNSKLWKLRSVLRATLVWEEIPDNE